MTDHHAEREEVRALLGDALLGALIGVADLDAPHLPPAVARLAMVVQIAADLRGGFTDRGVGRWFDRPRRVLGGQRPRDLLQGEWQPGDAQAQSVRELAEADLDFFAT